MILVDLSNVLIANIMVSIKTMPEINEDNIRHMVLNSLRSYNSKFGREYGELVLCCDGSRSWRKDVFPYYKANRKTSRDESTLDWKKLFQVIDTIRDEIDEAFPYRVLKVGGAEADDIIATLASVNSIEEINNNNRILIVSVDKDFGQLQRFPNVQQYNPVQKKMIEVRNPRAFLREHIIRGDVGDGVPNFLSNDNCLVMGIKQTPVMTKKVEVWLNQEPEEFCTTEMLLRNFRRNETMIDLTKIPEDVTKRILEAFEAQAGKGKGKILKYMMHHRLSKLMDFIQDF